VAPPDGVSHARGESLKQFPWIVLEVAENGAAVPWPIMVGLLDGSCSWPVGTSSARMRSVCGAPSGVSSILGVTDDPAAHVAQKAVSRFATILRITNREGSHEPRPEVLHALAR
jgi:hypothetical protein